MALIDRKYGNDVTIFTMAGKNLLGQFTQCTVELFADVANNTAIQDTGMHHRTLHTWWRIRGGLAVEMDLNNLMREVGKEVALALTSAPTEQGGTSYAGGGILTHFRHTIADTQMYDFELIGNGELTL